MKILYVIGAVLCLAALFLGKVYAVEICDAQDYYNLADPKDCKLDYETTGQKRDSKDAMFEIMKNYPFEKKDRFIKLFQRKVELVDTYIAQQKRKMQTDKVIANISKFDQTKQDLLRQEGLINASTQDNWGSVRDQARTSLQEAEERLRQVE